MLFAHFNFDDCPTGDDRTCGGELLRRLVIHLHMAAVVYEHPELDNRDLGTAISNAAEALSEFLRVRALEIEHEPLPCEPYSFGSGQ